MERRTGFWPKRLFLMGLLIAALVLGGCADDGDDGARGPEGPAGPPGSDLINASTAPDSILAETDVVSEITSVTIASPPVVEFTLASAAGVPIAGIGALREEFGERFVRFTITKLVPGTGGDPDTWVAYTRDTTNDGSTPPDYDTGTLVDHGDGSYTFTFTTDVGAVSGVTYEPALTHRVAGQIGDGDSALEPQNMFFDFVPAGGPVTNNKKVAVMESCNECHDDLVFHGRRFLVEYCVNCHNPDLAAGEGDMPYMIHKIHDSGTFEVLDDGVDYSEVGYPQELANCRKCHNGADAATPQGDNWKNVPYMSACDACHGVFAEGTHTGGPQADNSLCATCHPASAIEGYHVTPNATANNPDLLPGQYEIVYELDDAAISNNQLSVNFRVLADGEVLDFDNLPADLADGPAFLMAYALPQDGIATPADFNNLGRSAGQPMSVAISGDNTDCDANGCTFTVANPFPAGATLRTVGMQDYFNQTIGDDEVSLHTRSVVVTVTGDTARRELVDSAKCAACHEIFEGHGGNRNFTADGGVAICTLCHVPNLSSSGRSIDPAAAEARPSDAFEALGGDTLSWPEDTNNLKDMIHGIHASAFRTTDYEFVRGRNDGIYYNWHHVTFPAEVSNCQLCHLEGGNAVPDNPDLLPTTVRTTGVADGQDATFAAVGDARDAVPNGTDWVNTPVASACVYCHDSSLAIGHMEQNGGRVSTADGSQIRNRADVTDPMPLETCIVCHGPGKTADVNVVHGLD